MEKIEFGTDGWRGIIAQDFTFENVRVVAQAVADYLLAHCKSRVANRSYDKQKAISPKPAVVVGYDTRFISGKFAMAVARVLSGNEIKVILSDHFISSPILSYSVVDEKANLGVMITASHNPPRFNGFKIKSEFGAPADEIITGEVEKYLYRNKSKDSSDEIENKNLVSSYLKKINSMVDMELLKNVQLKIIYDPMFGAGMKLLPEVLKNTKCKMFNIHSDIDPFFGGVNPEPIKKNLGDLIKEVIKKEADIGIATDGDADRIGIVDNTGRYLTPNQVFPLLLSYLVEMKKLRGKIVQTISLGYLGERIAKFYNLSFQEVPVGFKYVSNLMTNEDVLMGGEESGGYGYRGYIPERDGILSALFFLEMIATRRRKLSWILDDIQHRFGKSYYDRMDIKISQESIVNSQELKEKMTKAIIKKVPSKIAGMKISEIRTYDGVKFILGSSNIVGGEAWLLLRPSGTEPLVRVYAEADNLGKVRELLKIGERMIKNNF